MAMNFQGLNPLLDFLSDCMLFVPYSYLTIDGKFSEHNAMDRDYWHDFSYSAYVGEAKPRANLVAKERISLDSPDHLDARGSERYNEVASMLTGKGTFAQYRQGQNHDFLLLRQGRTGDVEELTKRRMFAYEVADDLGRILQLDPELLMAKIRQKYTDHNVGEFTLNRHQVLELFSSLPGDKRRAAPIVYAAMKKFYDDLKTGTS